MDANVGTLAERLQVRHHTAVELLNRLEDGGFVHRKRDTQDRRLVHVSLTKRGEQILDELSLDHREELKAAGPALVKALGAALEGTGEQHPGELNKTNRQATNEHELKD
jgi:DNA-binding MarR family transcriptional regulator